MKLSRVPFGRASLLILICGLLFSLQAVRPPLVLAHANVVRSEPTSNSVAEQSPSAVTIWFTEPLEPNFSEIQVLDGDGQRVDGGDSSVHGQDPTILWVSLPALANGTYVVAWSNVSTVDGHKVRGSFLFSVGEPISAAAAIDMPSPPLVQSPFEPLLRWLTLLGAMIMVGGFGFEILIVRPVLKREEQSEAMRQLAARLVAAVLKTIWAAIGLFVVASCAHLLLQTVITYEISIPQALGEPLVSVLFDTSWGQLWLWRMGFLVLLPAVLDVALAASADPHNRDDNQTRFQRVSQPIALAAGMAILLTLSLSSHAAATAEIRAAAIFNDYLHLLAATFWAGGLIHLTVAIPLTVQTLPAPKRRTVLAALASRFSLLALMSMGILVVTGLYGSWAQITILPAIQTPYGWTLLAKLGIFAPILVLAAFNLLWVRPRLGREDRAARHLRHFVIGEAILAILLLLSVGLLTALEPARQVASRAGIGQEQGVSFQESVEGAAIAVELEPAQVGANRLLVTLADRRGNPIGNASEVSVRATYLDADLGESAVPASNLGDGRYAIQDLPLAMSGPWQMELVVRRPDAFDARTAFRFAVANGSAASSTVIAPRAVTGQQLWAAELALIGVTLVGTVLLNGRGRRTRSGTIFAVGGSAAILAAVLLMVNVHSGKPAAETAAVNGERPGAYEVTTATQQVGEGAPQREPEPQPSEGDPLRNPFPPNPVSLSQGQVVFEQNCTRCHGLTGRGDGPQAKGFDPPPADLLTHIPIHADIELFRIVRDGKSFSAMPGFAEILGKEQIWHLVNYLRAFQVDQSLAEEAYKRGVELVDAGDDEQALASFDEALARSPKHALAYHDRGNAYRRLGNLTQAIGDHSKAIEYKPGWAEAYYQRGFDHSDAQEPVQAILDYSKAIELSPDFGAAYYARGLAHIGAGDLPQAILDFNKTLELYPEYAQAHLDRGMAYYHSGDLASTLSDLQAYRELAPELEDQASVTALIAHIEAQLQTPSAQSVENRWPFLALPDLPSGFKAIPLTELGLDTGSIVGEGLVIESAFAFGDAKRFTLVWGFTTRLPTGDQGPGVVTTVDGDDLLALLQEGTSSTNILKQEDLSTPVGLGDAAVGLTAVVVAQEMHTRVDSLYFDTDTVGVFIFVMYADGQAPAVEIDDLARKLNVAMQ